MRSLRSLFGPQSMMHRPQASATATLELSQLAVNTLHRQFNALETAIAAGDAQLAHFAIHALRGSLMVLDAPLALETLNHLDWHDDAIENLRLRDIARLKTDIAALVRELCGMQSPPDV